MVKKGSELKIGGADALLELGAVVSDRVQIQNVHLLETRAKRGSIREKQPLHLRFSVNVTTQVDQSKSILLVRPLLTMIASHEDAADGEEALRIEALFVLAYRVDSLKGLDKTNFDAFGETNGLYNVWPFWREYVQATTARLGLPPLTIPVLPPAKRNVEASEQVRRTSPRPKRTKKPRQSSST
ncbi:MAG: hypothetical protein GXY55_02715 [Phycisphaerae bacterium]|nr:hypothetical protein [Phycisphaerae bacterium]